MFALIAVILFALAAFKVRWESIGIIELGLACLALHMLVGMWPFGTFFRNNASARNRE